jgi:hypothetical protein
LFVERFKIYVERSIWFVERIKFYVERSVLFVERLKTLWSVPGF